MDIFLTKMHCIPLQEAFIHKPELCDACFNMDGCTLFDYFWTIEQKHLPMHFKAWTSQDNFLNNSDWIRLKKESHTSNSIPWGWVKHGLIFIFGRTNPLKQLDMLWSETCNYFQK